MKIKPLDLIRFREENDLTQSDLARIMGVSRNTVYSYEKGKVIPDSKQDMLIEILSKGLAGNAKIIENKTVELEYISIKARAGFTDVAQQIHEPMPMFRVSRQESEDLTGQVVIEVDGDSMEPTFYTGTKVRCKPVPDGDWQYLNSGVYVVIYSSFFVVKRIKNSPVSGILTLHSDNTATGGTITIPISEVRYIWKVLRIVDAPVM